MASVDLITCAGAAMSTGRVAWGGSGNPLSRIPWIPKAGTPLMATDARGQMTNQLNPAWDRCLRWLFEEYIGGVKSPPIQAITQTIIKTQTQVVEVAVAASTAQVTASSAADAVNTTREVLINGGVSGAEQIPPAKKPSNGPSFEL